MVNVSKERWGLVRKKLPKNYREAICKVQRGLTVRQISMVIGGESKDIVLIKKVKGGVRKVLGQLGYTDLQIDELL